MSVLAKAMKAVMLVSGILTFTMVYAAIDPHGSMSSTFGEKLEGAAAEIVVRNWGALIALVGGMLVYGAFHPAARAMVLIVAGLSKVTFISLVLAQGGRYLGQQAGIAIVVDSVMVLIFATYLLIERRRAHAA
jgi:hypothetical protein